MKEHTCLSSNCSNRCKDFDESTRRTIFKTYWSLPYQQQRDFILNHIKIFEAEKPRLKGESRKSLSRHYFLPLCDQKVRVCRKFLLSTLDVTDYFVIQKITEATLPHPNKVSGDDMNQKIKLPKT